MTLTIRLNRAVALIEEKKARGPSKGRFGADPGRALGDHPDKGGPVVVKNGRYGPYASHDGVNATALRHDPGEHYARAGGRPSRRKGSAGRRRQGEGQEG